MVGEGGRRSRIDLLLAAVVMEERGTTDIRATPILGHGEWPAQFITRSFGELAGICREGEIEPS